MDDDGFDFDKARQARARAESGGDRWYDEHRAKFAPRVLRDDVEEEHVALYHAALRAQMAEAAMTKLRQRVRYEAAKISPGIPEEPRRDAGARVLAEVRPRVVRPDAEPANVSFYEALVAADEFRLFMDSAVRMVTEAAAAAQERDRPT